MSGIETRDDEGILVIELHRPPVNALDIETLDALADVLEDAGEEPDAVILTGRGSAFSAGADLRKVLEADPVYIDAGIVALARCFEALFVFPRPLIAAVNGYALAGGAVITCTADRRIMSEDAGLIGAVELKAGVPFPAWALEIVRHAVNNSHVEEVIYFGRSYSPTDALRIGLVDEVVPAAQLMSRATEVARELAEVPRETFGLTKNSLRRWTVETARRGMALTDEEVKAAWKLPEVHDAIRRLMASIGTRR
ncbi:MAG: enoyl-CoA hydratase [Actinomycetota bacterium]|jgi:enoyl-CoA hydratase|nr:enoyl-CoA hydratase [Actinomycetota bacterium]